MDYIVRATAANAGIRAFAAVTKELVEPARCAQEKRITQALWRRRLSGGL